MRRNFTLLLIVLCMGFASVAQTFKVQGVPHKGAPMKSPADDVCDVDFDKIQRWTGEGDKKAAFVVKWNLPQQTEGLYVWGYRWSDDADATGEQMIKRIALEDPQFCALIQEGTGYGTAVGGMGYDINGDGFAITDGTNTAEPGENGLMKTGGYSFDGWKGVGDDDMWWSGWYDGYWAYWVCNNPGETFGYSDLGATSRILTDGCVDGWSYVVDMDFDYCNMIGELYYLPALKSPVLTFTTAPADGETVESIKTVKFMSEEGIVPNPENTTPITIMSRFQGTVATSVSYDTTTPGECVVTFDEEVNTNGMYMISVPERFFVSDNGKAYNEAIDITYTVNAPRIINEAVTVDPAPGKVDSLKEFKLTYTEEEEAGWGDGMPALKDENGNLHEVETGFDNDDEMNQLRIYLTEEITAPGTYTLTLPAGCVLLSEEGIATTGERKFVYTIEKPEPEVDDYTKGTFIVNEDWFGHQNSTVNFLTDDGEWIYRVIQKENPGVELGCTNNFGTIYGNRFYLISKQEKDPGASTIGGRITVCDAKSMKVIKQIQNIAEDDNGKSIADGRGFLGVDEHKGYVGTSNGIYILDLDNLEITGSVSGSGNGENGGYGDLYGGQIGNMVRVGNRVFAVHQKNGLLVINPETDLVEQTVEAPETRGFGSVVLSKDGNLWLSICDKSGSGNADNRLFRLNPSTLETEIIDCTEGVYGPANSWYAWTPDCFCASTQNNVLYWNGGNSSWFSGKTVYKYDIDKNEFSTFIDFNNDPDGWQIYGCSFRMDPVSDEAFVSLFKNFGDPTYVLRKYDNEGNMEAEYDMISNYWFPSLPVFPDNEAPEVAAVNPVELTIMDGELISENEISIADIATDADNMTAAIVKTVKEVGNPEILTAELQGDTLIITPNEEGKAGTSNITLQINSNGKLAQVVIEVTLNVSTDVNNIADENATEVERYDANGNKLSAPQRGVNIVRLSNGNTIKVIVR